MVSTAAIFWVFAVGSGVGPSFSLGRLGRGAGARLSPTAEAFQGAAGSAVPSTVWNEKHSKVLYPVLPHLQQPSWFLLWASISCWGTPFRATAVFSHFVDRPPSLLASCQSSLRGGRRSFFRSSLHCSSVRLALPVGFPCSLACFRAFFFSTCSAAW